MELAKNIRLKIGKSLLKKKAEKTTRKVCYTNIDSVKKIGIVWDAAEISDFASLSRFYQKMNDRDIELKILSYYPGKNLPDQYTAIRYLRFIRRDEVSFIYHPFSAESEDFIRNRFDVLIDLNFKNLLPLKYITTLSKAALKVGLFEDEKDGNIFDLMFDIRKPVNIENYLEQTLLYLEMIHAEPAKQIH